jgi:ABC-type branched-subunit amino acid transport system substrate-binding protein
LPQLVELRAGGLIPIARQYPGTREFVESYRTEFPGADPGAATAAGYAGCQILLEAVKRAGSLESGTVRDVILKMDLNTVFGAFKVDRDGLQIAHKVLIGRDDAGGVPAKFYEVLGRDAEFVYMATHWLPELVEVRAGGLIPIARQYPGAREFVESYKKEFPGATPSAPSYGACQILVEAVKRAGSLDGVKVREAISKMDHNTVFGRFRVDRGPDRAQDAAVPVAGRQEGHRLARGAGDHEGALPDAAVEPAPVSHARKVVAVALVAARPTWASGRCRSMRPGPNIQACRDGGCKRLSHRARRRPAGARRRWQPLMRRWGEEADRQ